MPKSVIKIRITHRHPDNYHGRGRRLRRHHDADDNDDNVSAALNHNINDDHHHDQDNFEYNDDDDDHHHAAAHPAGSQPNRHRRFAGYHRADGRLPGLWLRRCL